MQVRLNERSLAHCDAIMEAVKQGFEEDGATVIPPCEGPAECVRFALAAMAARAAHDAAGMARDLVFVRGRGEMR